MKGLRVIMMAHDNQNADAAEAVDWEAVYWEQMPRLYNFFRYRTGDDDAAQDLTATTFAKAWRFRENYCRDLGEFAAWLFAIARNIARDYLRYRRRKPPGLPLDAAFHVASGLSVEREAQQKQDFQQLYRLVGRLSKTDQELVALKYGADLTNRAIAKVMELSESNVGTRLHRIVKKLRKQWEGTPWEDIPYET